MGFVIALVPLGGVAPAQEYKAQQLIAEFITGYNAEWLIERLGHRTPTAARAAALAA
jgi:hypothetical protein